MRVVAQRVSRARVSVAGETTGEMTPNRPGVLEHLTVISGRLTFAIDGEAVELGPQDSATYGPARTEYRNEGAEPCHYLIVIDSSRAASAGSHGAAAAERETGEGDRGAPARAEGTG